jgi:hypothetical protein
MARSLHLSVAILLITFGTGCYFYHNVNITVLDAESCEPIAGASVRTFYDTDLLSVRPREDSGTTDMQGHVRLRLANYPHSGISPWAQGYQPYLAVPVRRDDSTWVPVPPSERPASPFDHITLALWREPAPAITLIVPDGFRGVVRIEEPLAFSPLCRHRARDFQIPLEPGKTVVLDDIPPSAVERNFKWKYSDARPFQFLRHPSDDMVMPRHLWLGTVPEVYEDAHGVPSLRPKRPNVKCWEFVFGTREDQRVARQEVTRRFAMGEPLPADFVLPSQKAK